MNPAFRSPSEPSSPARHWTRVCGLEDILPESGAAAWVDGHEVAVFRVRDAVYAIGNLDPASGANVIARGIVGDLGGEIVVASPMYKQHFSLITGRCLEDPALSVPAYLARVMDGEIWIRGKAVPRRRSAHKRRLVVIGNGMIAARTLEDLLEFEPQRHDITVFGGEPQGSYNRVLLSPLLAGDRPLAEVVTHPPDWYSRRRITLQADDPIEHIDRTRRRVRSRSGLEVAYDRLLIATGSQPIVLGIPGTSLDGVISFRDLRDVESMMTAARTQRRAIVIGGGLLGLEAAHGLRRRGMSVTVVHIEKHLMERQLDEPAAGLLRTEFEQRGIEFAMPAEAAQILGKTRVTGVRLADGRELAGDLVVMAVGVRPNIELARAAGLHCDRGVLVDDTLLTNDPSIYAVGECVQHRGRTFGLVAPLFDQARICAAYLAERAVRGFRPQPVSASLKVGGIDLFSAGDCAPAPGTESLVLRDAARGVYRRLLLHRDRVRGAVLYGDTSGGRWYVELIEKGESVASLRNELLFGAPEKRAAGGS
ncbi:MAG TPA: nitrite reductase small subunit NirD [Steroidobacteraceae bacterium]